MCTACDLNSSLLIYIKGPFIGSTHLKVHSKSECYLFSVKADRDRHKQHNNITALMEVGIEVGDHTDTEEILREVSTEKMACGLDLKEIHSLSTYSLSCSQRNNMFLKQNAGILLPERWIRHPFSYSSHQLQLTLQMLCVKHTKTRKGKDKKVVTLGTSGHEE